MTNVKEPLNRFEADLLPMLMEVARDTELAPQRPVAVPPARRLRRFALATAAGVSLALAVPLFTDDPLRGALAIDRRGDTIYVSVKDAAADPEAMTNDLRAQGLPATVEVTPTSPSLEGAWVDIVNDNLSAGFNDPRMSDIFTQITKRPEVLELPADFSTPFTLVVGRPAQAGERYIIAASIDVDDVEGCLGIEGMTVSEGRDALEERGFEVLSEPSDDEVIVGANFLGPTTVVVNSADPGSQAASEAQNQPPSTESC